MAKSSKSLRNRLTTLVVAAVFGAVGLTTASSIWREVSQFTDDRQTELTATATVFASTIAEPVKRGEVTALGALAAVTRAPMIEYARIEAPNGVLIAEMGDAGAQAESAVQEYIREYLPQDAALKMLTARSFKAAAPIVDGDETIGVLTIFASTQSLSTRIGVMLYDAFVAAIFTGGIGVLITLKFQRAVTEPILSLARVMKRVRESGDFSVRAEPAGDDETAQLVATFNTMLDQIQERDHKLRAHQLNLKKTVERKTLQLRKAKEAAEAANMAKSDFLATMSHEIRTPMNGMLAMADLLNKARLAPQQKRYAEVIAKSGQSLLAIINDILDFSKIEAGRLEFEKIAVRPADIVNEVVSLFWERAAAKGIDLAAYVAPNTPEEIEGDPVRISQVVSNLVNNALKFTQEGHVIVAVACKPCKPGVKENNRERSIEFSVADTGVGIAPEKQSAIFEAFSQADQTTTRKFGGTGLGLAISRRLVEAMGGAIGLESTPGDGARFFFGVPTVEIHPPLNVRKVEGEKRAIIAIDGDATAKMLARYIRETGVIPHIVDQGAPMGPHIAYADMIFASVAFFEAYQRSIDKGAAQWIPARICVCELGETKSEQLLESGVVEDILMSPISRQDVLQQVDRILDDKMRGPSALQETHNTGSSLVAFNGQHVLAADDSAVNREVVREALRRLNLKVTLASDGRQATHLAQTRHFDLILMDCSMPEMDGFEATQAIRALENQCKRPRTPIIALSAHVAGSSDKWRSVGMDNYLTKPFTIASLAAALGEFLEFADGPAAQADESACENETSGPAPADQCAAPFDRDVLEQIRQMQPDLPFRALSLFNEHAREAMRKLAAQIKTGDQENIAKAAHALKSMSVNVGARQLGEACKALELRAREGAPVAELSTLSKDVVRTYREAQAALPGIAAEYKSAAA